ncbi:MAG: hypothetical protein AB7E49_10575 [Campylobacterales bacterium]
MIKQAILWLAACSLMLAQPFDATPPPAVEQKPFFTGNNAHKYLGYATLIAAALSGLAPKEEGGLHEYAGYAAGGLAIATTATGLAYHMDDIHPGYGLKDPDNIHALLGAGGALIMAAGLASAPEDSHAGPAAAGAGLMMLSLYFVW